MPGMGCGRARDPSACAWRDVTARPALARRLVELGEPALRNRVADVAHQPLVVSDVDLGEQHRAERLSGADEMVQIGVRGLTRGGPGALLIQRPRIIDMPRIAQIDRAEPRERDAMTPV